MKSMKEQFARMMDEARPINAPTLAKVISVDVSKKICKVSFADGRPTNDRVFLQASPDAEIIIVPAIGSIVLVGFADNILTRAYILSISKVQKIILKTSPNGILELSITDDGFDLSVGAKGKVHIDSSGTIVGNGAAEPMVKGQSLAMWASSVDAAITALLAWAESGVAPGPAGGIAPLSGVTSSVWDNATLSQENKVV